MGGNVLELGKSMCEGPEAGVQTVRTRVAALLGEYMA